ncbi:peptidoglycan/LPS O-acetylase OafA/YrhL [Microvirga flocculans]|uniref:Peptidoglycan/LPS O-acetylase OafA/YrhL n=1 Tax=Microvirga flocculans TaxID=217168 RepID=A0A7W6IDP7_9HYPH|nr:acyltransferase [Microvirga flocculans]MBB4039590.1 peptidoglycan/LPS O-acetylase OafA/YrhL [Microvirga flocculans]
MKGLEPPAEGKAGSHWPFLDLLRFGAALLVLIGHTRGLVFVSFQDIAQAGLATKAFYFLTGIHREGVAIFFAVSGFLVGGAAWRAIRDGRFTARTYFASRFARIYIVLLPALALTVLLDWIGRTYLIDTRFFSERPLEPIDVTSHWSWGQMACNVAAVQGIFCKPLGPNPPLWSLGYEWVFYLLAPVLFGLCLAKIPRAAKVAAVALLFVAMSHFAGGMLRWVPWLAIWLGGAFAAQVARERDLPILVGLLGLGAVMAGFVLSRLQIVPVYGTDLMVGLGAGLAIANRRLLSWCPLRGPVRTGADFSYSLYLIHVPVAVLAGGMLERLGGPSVLAPPGPVAYAVFAALLGAALATAFLFSLVTERHTDRLRRLLVGRRALTATMPKPA